MKKLFVENIEGDSITLTGDDHKHIAYSLRTKVGDKIVLCCKGSDYNTEVVKILKDKTHLKILSSNLSDSEPKVELTLFTAPLKGDKTDWAVQKCVELGAKNIVPFISKNTQLKQENVKAERLNRISLEAAKQSGRGFVPPVHNAVTFDEMLKLIKDGEFNLNVFLYEGGGEDIKSFLRRKEAKKIALIVGPEGGFTPEEAQSLKAFGGSVSLGKRILRAETACVAAAAIIMYESGEYQ